MRRPLLALALIVFLAGGLRGQLGEVGLVVHHSFPEAGRPLRLVVEGVEGSLAVVRVADFGDAPQAAVKFLAERFPAQERVRDALDFDVRVDLPGLVVLSLPLGTEDVGRKLKLEVTDESRATIHLQLVVQPPMVLVPSDQGLARIDLLEGRLIEPTLSGRGGLRGAALSQNGLSYYLLRDAGRLEVGSALSWDDPRPLLQLDPAGDELAFSRALGPAFVIVRPDASPFAPPGSLVFVDRPVDELFVESMAQPVDGRRWALSDDGLTAFVAEDELLVREVDLVTGAAGSLFTAGFAADRAIVDMAWQDGRLLVLTRRPEGRSGGVTVLDLSTGWLNVLPLQSDPVRLVSVGPDTALVVPAAGPLLETLEQGLPVGHEDLAVWGVATIVDAAPVTGGALLLTRGVDGTSRLLRWDDRLGAAPLETLGIVPDATRLAGAGHSVAVLLGDPSGALFRVDLVAGRVDVLPGVRSEPGAPFVMLP